MVEITIVYEGKLHCSAKHTPSGSVISTDAPKDNMGLGESFSPTDLVATALGTCILTTMGIVAQRNNWDMSGSTARVTKEMVMSPVRRIGRLAVEIRVPHDFNEETRARLDAAAHGCPVHKSLHPDVDAPIAIQWGK